MVVIQSDLPGKDQFTAVLSGFLIAKGRWWEVQSWERRREECRDTGDEEGSLWCSLVPVGYSSSGPISLNKEPAC